MRTVKEKIRDAFVQLEIPFAYADSTLSELPRLNYTLIYTHTARYSNKRHSKRPVYQVDFFTHKPEDVEGDVLESILLALEAQGLTVSDFREVVRPDADENLTYYHYYTQVH